MYKLFPFWKKKKERKFNVWKCLHCKMGLIQMKTNRAMSYGFGKVKASKTCKCILLFASHLTFLYVRPKELQSSKGVEQWGLCKRKPIWTAVYSATWYFVNIFRSAYNVARVIPGTKVQRNVQFPILQGEQSIISWIIYWTKQSTT